MKNLARFATVAAVLGTVWLSSGCTTTVSRAPRVQPVANFTVVDSSTEKELTPAQLADLQEAVINYLREQGLSSNRVYYVKVNFPSDNPEDAEQWAIVRIGNLPTRTYTILAAYPGPDDSYPYGYYAAGYAGYTPYGYYDPFDYNYGYYVPPAPRRDHKPDERPRIAPTGWDSNRPDPDQPHRDHPGNTTTQPPLSRDHDRDRVRPDNSSPRTWTRNRPDDGNRDNGGSRDWSRDRSGGSSSPSYTPPPAPVRSDPPSRNESPSPVQSSRDKSDSPTNEK